MLPFRKDANSFVSLSVHNGIPSAKVPKVGELPSLVLTDSATNTKDGGISTIFRLAMIKWVNQTEETVAIGSGRDERDVMSAVAFSSHQFQDSLNSYEGNRATYETSYDPVSGVYEGWSPFLDLICDPCPALDSNSLTLDGEDVFRSLISLPHVEPDVGYGNDIYRSWGYWKNEDDSYFRSWCCWDDNYTSLADENLYGSGDGIAEDFLREGQQRDNSLSHHECGESQLSWDEVPWSEQDSWLFGHREEDDSSYYGWHDAACPHKGGSEETEFCGEIFGYWPYLD